MQPHRGTMILVLGILGIVCCPFLGIAAIVMGSGDLKAMAEGRMDRGGEGLTNAGRICGIIGLVLFAIGLVLQLTGIFTFGPQQFGK